MTAYLNRISLAILFSSLTLFGASVLRCHAIEERFDLDSKVLNKKYAMPPSRTGSAIMAPPVAPAPAPKSVRAQKPPASKQKKAKQTAVRASSSERRSTRSTPTRGTGPEAVLEARRVWSELIPSTRVGIDQFGYISSAFSLSLDPERYPMMPAQDGGSILVDGMGTLPALVKSLVQDKNPLVRIVSESPDNRRRFYRSLLEAAKFYSVEEDFLVDFGTESKITLHADFRIEKSADSLLRQDLILLKVAENRRPAPEALVRLLAKNGFRLIHAATSYREIEPAKANQLYQITEKEPKKIADSILDAVGISAQTGKSIDLYARDDIGVRLEVPVDRYFEYNGRPFVIALFSGDPVSYTLVRLLETKGYRVVVLQEGEDLHSVADKVLTSLRIPATYGEHDLWPVAEVGYGVQLSGVMIRDRSKGDGAVFLTDRTLDPVVRELADVNGYRLTGR